jgi:RNA polymerase sigma-70 factor (ECF subfamily)
VIELPTDEQLIMEINGGSQAALEVLTKRYYKHVYAYLYRKIGSTHTVYDLTQDVFVKMMRGLPTYTRKVSFHSWLYTIAVNCCRDYYRSAAYRQSLTAMEYEEYHQQSNGESVSYIFERRETRKQLRQAIQALPDVQSEDAGNTLELRWAGGSTITNGGAKARLSFISTGTRNFPRFAGQAREDYFGWSL